VFAQVQGGGPSVGAAGVPKTMIAGMGVGPPTLNPNAPPMQPGGYPGAPPPGYPGGGPPGAPGGWGAPPGGGSAAKTMIAGQAPPMGAAPGMPGQPPVGYPGQPGFTPTGGPPPGGYAMPGTPGYVAAAPAQKTMMVGMQAPVLPGGGPPPPAGPPPAAGPGPAKTVLLQATDGVVSVAGKGPIASADEPAAGGASAAFWVISMLLGIGLGALAYVIMLQF
jgi:hypothetical protein